MKRNKRKSRLKNLLGRKIGLPPATLVYVGAEEPGPAPRVTVYSFSATSFSSHQDITPDECAALKEGKTGLWINIEGLKDIALVEKFGRMFDIHPLALEDVLNTTQRPKVEPYPDSLFVVMKMPLFRPDSEVLYEQVSFALGRGYLISFQEGIEGDVFHSLRAALESNRGGIRSLGPDYLLYRMVDSIVDGYFKVVDNLVAVTERLEDKVLVNTEIDSLMEIQQLKHDLAFVRRAIWPIRDAMHVIQRDDSGLIDGRHLVFFRDVYDHAVQIVDAVEMLRDAAASCLEIYLSTVSNRMNSVMKVLTVISTIFMPLTFIAGVYGMNFDYMPELHWRYGYHLSLLIMAVSAATMVFYFKRRRWF